jgi:hypothetical protein
MAQSEGKPWVFYMTHDFINHCLETVEHVLTGFGAFINEK